MMILLTGKPGMGKTLTLTSFAYKNFKEKNPPFRIWIKEHILRKKHIYDLSEYSDYPIVFKKPKKNKKYLFYDELGNVCESDHLSSLKFRIFDLFLENKFKEGANFYIDEIQCKYDSMEYKDFPDAIAHYCQAHRHFDNNIYIASQSQSRVIKRLLVLCEEYWNIQSFRKIFGFVICRIRRSWELSASLESNASADLYTDCDYFTKIYRLKKVGNMYDSKYLKYLQENARPYPCRMYNELQLSKNGLLNQFFPSEELKEHLKNMRY